MYCSRTFRIYSFLSAGVGEGRRCLRRWPGRSVLIHNAGRGGGGLSEEEALGGEGAGVVCGEAGWAKQYYFWGAELPTKYFKKNQPKQEVFGTEIPRTSGGHSRGYPGPKLRSGRSKPWKINKHLGADIHDPKARTSTTLRDVQKLRSEKLWAEFSIPSIVVLVAPYCAILRDSAILSYCALWGCWCINMADWVRYPLPLF